MKKNIAVFLALSLILGMFIPSFSGQNSAGTLYLSTRIVDSSLKEISSVAKDDTFFIELSFAGNGTTKDTSAQAYSIYFENFLKTKMSFVSGMNGADAEATNGVKTSFSANVIGDSFLIMNGADNEGFYKVEGSGFSKKNVIISSGILGYIQVKALSALTSEELKAIRLTTSAINSQGSKVNTDIKNKAGLSFDVVFTPALTVAVNSNQTVYTSADLTKIKEALSSATFIYADGTQETFTSSNTTSWTALTVATKSALAAGVNTVTATYNSKSVDFNITATAVTLSDLSVTKQPTKTEYSYNDTVDLDGMTIKAVYNDGSTNSAFTGYKAYIGSTEITSGTTKLTRAMNGKKIVIKAGSVETSTSAITVNQKTVTPSIGDIAAQVYTGSKISPEITVTTTEQVALTKDTDYTVSYGANTDCGLGYVTISAVNNSNYTFAAVGKTFNITKTAGSIKFNDASSLNREYDTTATADPAVTKAGNGNVSYAYYKDNSNSIGSSISAPKDAGKYWVVATVAADTNHEAASSAALFTISKAALTVTAKSKAITYKDAAANDGVTYSSFKGSETSGNALNTSGLTYEYSYKANDNAGDYVITPKGITSTNYAITYVAGKLTVGAKTVSTPVISGASTQVYTGNDITFNSIEVLDGDTVIPSSEYAVSYSNNKNVGTATVTITDKTNGNYTVSGTTTFAITQKDIADVNVITNANQNVVIGLGNFVEPVFKFADDTITGELKYTVTVDSTIKVNDGTSKAAIDALKVLAKSSTGAITWTFTPDSSSTPSKNYKGTTNGSISFTMVDIEFLVGSAQATGENTVKVTDANKVYGKTWNEIVTGINTLKAKVDTNEDNNQSHFSYKVIKDTTAQTLSTHPNAGDYNVVVIYNGTIGGKTYTDVEVCRLPITVAPKTLTIDQSNAQIKREYEKDKLDAGTLSGSLGLTGVIEGDVVSVVTASGITYGKYSSDAVGNNYSITMEGITLEGTDKANYSIASAYTFTGAEITKIIPKLANVNVVTPAAAAYAKTSRAAIVTTQAGTGFGEMTVWYKQFETGTSAAVAGTLTKDAPVNAGKYYVEVSFADGTNFGATTNNITSAAWTVEIPQADRNFTITQNYTLLPGSETVALAPAVAQNGDLDSDVSYTYTSADTKYVYVDKSGNVKGAAQTSGAITLTVAAVETNNYKATSAALAVKSWVEPLKLASATNLAQGSEISVAIDGQTVNAAGTISDSAVGLTIQLTPADGLTIEEGNPITLTPEEVSAASVAGIEKYITIAGVGVKYTVKTSGLVNKPSDVVIQDEEKVTAPAIENFNGDPSHKGYIQEAIEDVNTFVKGLKEAAAKTVIEAAKTFKDNLAAAVSSQIVKYDIKIEAKIVAEEHSGSQVKIDIEPQYVIEGKDNNNAVVVSEPAVSLAGKVFDTPVTVNFKIPNGYSGEPKYAKHEYETGKFEFFKVRYDSGNNVASWDMFSFSPVTLISSDPTVNVTFNHVDGSTQDIEYKLVNVDDALPVASQPGKNFDGWVLYENGVATTSAIKTMTEDILTRLDAKTVTAAAVFSNPYTPSYYEPTYSVKAVNGENYVITVSPSDATIGSTVTITVAPKLGYDIAKVSAIKSSRNTEIELTEVSAGVYTFKMPGTNVTVKAEVKAAELNFVDVDANAYYADAVSWAILNKVTDGVDSTHFAPTRVCTRAEAFAFLYKAIGSPDVELKYSFTDVEKDSYYEKAVAWAVKEGLTDGVGGNLFAPDLECDRAQIITLLARYAKATGNTIYSFTDVEKGSYYESSVGWAEANDIIDGIGENRFAPEMECDRAQIVTLLYRFSLKGLLK